MNLYEEIVNANPKLKRGVVYCLTCRRTKVVDSARCLRHGWPKCCGATMSLDHPDDRSPNEEGT